MLSGLALMLALHAAGALTDQQPSQTDLTRGSAGLDPFGTALTVLWSLAALLCAFVRDRPALGLGAAALALTLNVAVVTGSSIEAPLLPGLPSPLQSAVHLGHFDRASAWLEASAAQRPAPSQAYLGAQIAAARGDAASVRHLLLPWLQRLDGQLYEADQHLPHDPAPCCLDWRPDVLARLETQAFGAPVSAAALAHHQTDSAPRHDPDGARGAWALGLAVLFGILAGSVSLIWRRMREHHGRIRALLTALRLTSPEVDAAGGS